MPRQQFSVSHAKTRDRVSGFCRVRQSEAKPSTQGACRGTRSPPAARPVKAALSLSTDGPFRSGMSNILSERMCRSGLCRSARSGGSL